MDNLARARARAEDRGADASDVAFDEALQLFAQVHILARHRVFLGWQASNIDHAVVELMASCRRWLATNAPDAELRPVSSTARAAADVADSGRPDVAAIANPLAVERYGLDEVARL